MSIQDRLQVAIYSLGEGAGRQMLRALITMLAFALVAVLYLGSQFRGLRDAESMELAHLGRRLAEGHGFTTRCLRPADLSLLQRRGAAPDPAAGVPDIRHAPLYPAVLATVFRATTPVFQAKTVSRPFAPEVRVLLPVGAALLLVSGVIVFVAGWALFGPRVAATALIVLLFSRAALDGVATGGSVMLQMAVTTLALALALGAARWRQRRRHPAGWILLTVGAGAAAGLAVLTAYPLVAVVPAVAALVGSGFVRWRSSMVALCLLVAVAVAAPWLARTMRVSGNPLGVVPYTALEGSLLHEDGSLDRSPVAAPGTRETMLAMRLKFVERLGDGYGRNLRTLGDGLVIAFFLVALFYRQEEDGATALKWCVLLALAVRLMLAALGRPSPDTLLPFLPFVALVGSALLFRLLEQMTTVTSEMRAVVAGAWVTLALAPTLLVLAGPGARAAYPPYAPSFVRYVAGLVPDDAVVATDIPWAMAWYGDRSALLLPPSPAALVATRAGGMPVCGVYLTTETGDEPYVGSLLQGREQAWLPVLNRLVPEDFPWQHGVAVPPGRRDQLYLTDQPRWESPAPAPASASGGGSASGG